MQDQHPQIRGRSTTSTQLWGQRHQQPLHIPGGSRDPAPRQPSPSGSFCLMSVSLPQRVIPRAGKLRFLPKFLLIHCLLAELCVSLLPGPKALEGTISKVFPLTGSNHVSCPETTEVLNTKQGHGGAAQPHGAQTSLRCLHSARLLRLERKGKTPGEVWRKKEGEWRGRRDGGSTHFSLRALTHQDPGG